MPLRRETTASGNSCDTIDAPLVNMCTHTQVLIAAALLSASMTASAATLPKAVSSHIPSGYEVLLHKNGDLNNDGRTDYLIALQRANELHIASKTGTAPRRPLVLFIQGTDGTFALARRNDHVILAADQGGQCDPFEEFNEDASGFAIKGAYFTVQHSVACGAHWTDYITFRYDAALRDWVFHNRIAEGWVMNNGSDPNESALVPGHRQVTTSKGKPVILFEKYRPK
ncbi:MAG TPA: hypothetical protein VEC35_18395 [Noviherbaspirillum sp.]|nr:hypothetical protein [Noviherbaspirillum sp.]